MKTKKILIISFFVLVLFGFVSCKQSVSNLVFTNSEGNNLELLALNKNAKKAFLNGKNENAWFAFTEPLFNEKAIEVKFTVEEGEAELVSFGLVTKDDFTGFPTLKKNPSPRNLCQIKRVKNTCSIRMEIPSSVSQNGLYGFAFNLINSSKSKIKIVDARSVNKEVGWDASSPIFLWTGFTSEGGVIDLPSCYANDFIELPQIVLEKNTVLNLNINAESMKFESPNTQERIRFKVGEKNISIRLSPQRFVTSFPASFFAEKNPILTVLSNNHCIKSMRLVKENISMPLKVDPFMMVEYPQNAWRNKDFEVFAWDRFPSVFVFDTANYRIQDSLFKRLAFFVEKQGYRGRIVDEDEVKNLHAFNAHDYRAESLAEFFNTARQLDIKLNDYEKYLKDFLFKEGVLLLSDNKIVPGAGAVLSLSRESPSYLRYLFINHEGYHGIYFVSPEFRDKVNEIYLAQNPLAIDFLKSYFTVIDSLGYDLDDPYLMENEFMAYLMQQSVANVSSYFTGTIYNSYLSNGGNPELAAYIKKSNASSFVRGAEQISDYVFSRWGIVAGRIGLLLFN